MNHTHLNDADAVNAMLGIDLPGTVDPSEPPSEIQWMPPGVHEICASRGGEPFPATVTVDESGAQRVAAAFAAHTAAAARGEDDVCYFDLNHDDKEASAHPTSFYWGGTDPQRGGIRARVQWTGTGRAAVLGRSYRRFSPSFFLDDAGHLKGIPVNAGGLVNRAAFKRIAPIIAKEAAVAVLASSRVDFMSKAETLKKLRNLDIGEAIEALAHERGGYDYDVYRANLLGLPLPAQPPVNAQLSSAENDEFMIRARALSETLDIDLVSAADKVCGSNPSLYDRYRARLFGLDDARPIAAARTSEGPSEFFKLSETIAAQRGCDITEAFSIVAARRPDLYDACRPRF